MSNTNMGLSAEELEAMKDDQDEALEVVDEALDDPEVDSEEVEPEYQGEDREVQAEPVEDALEEKDEQFVHVPNVQAVEDYENKIADFDKREDELADKFDDGDLTQREYRQELRKIEEERRSIENQQAEFTRSQELAQAKWQWEIDNFMDSTKTAEDIDYKTNKLLRSALDTAVRELAQDPSNDDKSGRWFLKQAHTQVKELFGRATEAPQAVEKKGRKPDLSNVPTTLAKAPAAKAEIPQSDEFGHLEKLSGMSLERALAKMTPDQVERYLNA